LRASPEFGATNQRVIHRSGRIGRESGARRRPPAQNR
jgi:hypothetical protein